MSPAQRIKFPKAHTKRTPPGHGRTKQFGKERRPIGDPVAEPKEPLRFVPAPPPATPGNFHLPLEAIVPKVAEEAAKKKLVFHCVGDTGGIHGESVQTAIAEAMEAQIKETKGANQPAFFYHLGDVVYFNGLSCEYKWQFYEPYQYYPAPIFAIPGNHDGAIEVQAGDPPDNEPTLTGFLRNFCDSSPHEAPYRPTMTQPYVYWTLDAPLVTIIGLYSNVEGSLDARGRSEQQQWLTAEMKAAPADKKLLIAVHHPCFSLDKPHGGCPDILTAIDSAIVASNRLPDAVLSGHVHNYQRFSREINGKRVPYLVAGAGGYANTPKSLHKLQEGIDTSRLPYQTTHTDVQLESANHDEPGYLLVTVTDTDITFDYFIVPFDGSSPSKFDTITI
jgi:Calcineurin-like phosphoesterase